MSSSIRFRTTAEVPRGRRGSSSVEESEEELGGRLEDALRRGEAARAGAFLVQVLWVLLCLLVDHEGV